MYVDDIASIKSEETRELGGCLVLRQKGSCNENKENIAKHGRTSMNYLSKDLEQKDSDHEAAPSTYEHVKRRRKKLVKGRL